MAKKTLNPLLALGKPQPVAPKPVVDQATSPLYAPQQPNPLKTQPQIKQAETLPVQNNPLVVNKKSNFDVNWALDIVTGKNKNFVQKVTTDQNTNGAPSNLPQIQNNIAKDLWTDQANTLVTDYKNNLDQVNKGITSEMTQLQNMETAVGSRFDPTSFNKVKSDYNTIQSLQSQGLTTDQIAQKTWLDTSYINDVQLWQFDKYVSLTPQEEARQTQYITMQKEKNTQDYNNSLAQLDENTKRLQEDYTKTFDRQKKQNDIAATNVSRILWRMGGSVGTGTIEWLNNIDSMANQALTDLTTNFKRDNVDLSNQRLQLAQTYTYNDWLLQKQLTDAVKEAKNNYFSTVTAIQTKYGTTSIAGAKAIAETTQNFVNQVMDTYKNFGDLKTQNLNNLLSVRDQVIQEETFDITKRQQALNEVKDSLAWYSRAQIMDYVKQKGLPPEYVDLLENQQLTSAVNTLNSLKGAESLQLGSKYSADIKAYLDKWYSANAAINQVLGKVQTDIANTPEAQKSLLDLQKTQWDLSALWLGNGINIDRNTAISKYGSSAAVRNFNPWNIMDTWFGWTKVPWERFTRFDTPAQWFAALVAKIQNIQNWNSKVYSPDMTLLQYISKYAPSSDGNNPSSYANSVANDIGVTVNTQIKDIDPVKLAAAHAKHEDRNSYKMLLDLWFITKDWTTQNNNNTFSEAQIRQFKNYNWNSIPEEYKTQAQKDKFLSDYSNWQAQNPDVLTKDERTEVRSTIDNLASDPSYKAYETIRSKETARNWIVSRLDDGTATPQDKQALISDFAKVLDPTSVVREWEYALAGKYSQSKIGKRKQEVTNYFTTGWPLSDEAAKLLAWWLKRQYDSLAQDHDKAIDNKLNWLNLILQKKLPVDVLQTSYARNMSQSTANSTINQTTNRWRKQ